MKTDRLHLLRVAAGVASLMAGAVVLPVAANAQEADEQSVPVAFTHVAMLPMDRERVLTDRTVVVRGGRIAAIGPAREVRVPRGAIRIDGRGKYLMPGLGDMHTHLAVSGTVHAERHLLLLLAAGVTTVRNMDYRSDFQLSKTSPALDGPGLLRLKARVASGELLGPRIYTSAAWREDTTKSVDASVAAYKAAGYDHIKWRGEDSVTTDSLAAAARRLGVPLVGHGIDGVFGGLARTLALGVRSVEHIVPYRNDSTLPAQVAATVQAGVWNCICPLPPHGTDPSPLERRYAGAELRALSGIEPDTHSVAQYSKPVPLADAPAYWAGDTLPDWDAIIRALHAGGAKLLLGTDTPVPGVGAIPTMLHRNLQSAVRLGLTPYEALVLVTRNVAEYFGTSDSVGTVTVGKRADLVLLGSNPLADIRHVSDVAGVMVGGRWLAEADLERRLDAAYVRMSNARSPKVGR